MGRAEVTASLDGTLLIVGQGALVDGLARQLSSEGIELVRASRDQVTELARVSAPDLILLAGESAADGGSHVLERLVTSGLAAAQPVLVIGGRAVLALEAVALRSTVAALVPEGGLELCAQRIRRLVERLAARGLEGRTLQAVVDEITRGPTAAEPQTAVTVKQPSRAAAPDAARKKTRSPTLVGLPTVSPASAIPASVSIAAGAKKRAAAAPTTTAPKAPTRSRTAAGATDAAIDQALDAAPFFAAHGPAMSATVGLVEPERAAGARMVEPTRSVHVQLTPVSGVGEVAAAVTTHAFAPSAAERRVPAAGAETPSLAARSAVAISPFARTMAAGSPEPPPAKLTAPSMLSRWSVPRGAVMAWVPVLRASIARPWVLTAAAMLFVGGAGMLAVVARGGRTEPSAATASLAAAAHHASSDVRPSAASMRLAAATAPPIATRAKTTQRGSSNTKDHARQTRALAPAETPANHRAGADVDEAPGREERPASKTLRPDRQRKLERANRLVDEGHGLLKRGHLGLAESAYMKALTAWPDLPRALAGLTRVHLQRKDGSEAVRWAKRLVAKEPKSGQNQLLLGDAWALRGNAKYARAAWLQAVRYANSTARKRLKDQPVVKGGARRR
jgi:histone H1/5